MNTCPQPHNESVREEERHLRTCLVTRLVLQQTILPLSLGSQGLCSLADGNSHCTLERLQQHRLLSPCCGVGASGFPHSVSLAFVGFSVTLSRMQGGSESLPRITNGSGGKEGNKEDCLQN